VPKLVSFPKPGGFFSEQLPSIPSGGGGTVAAGTLGGDGMLLPPNVSFKHAQKWLALQSVLHKQMHVENGQWTEPK
jgi:hypothetical protein